MTSRLPLTPLPNTISRRKSRVCTREACETCREKKAKCDGGKPCSRCKSRGEQCAYRTRSHQTKRSLQAELAKLRDAQRQRDAVLGALAAPGQTHDVLFRLWSGETFDKIYENLETRTLSSPAVSQASDASSQSEYVKEEPSTTLPQSSLCSPPILDYSNSANFQRQGTDYIQGVIDGHDSSSPSIGEESDSAMPHVDTSIFDNMSLQDGNSQYGIMNHTPTLPFGMLMDHNAPMIDPKGHYSDQTHPADNVGTINWWHPGDSDPTLPSHAGISPPTDPAVWPYPQYMVPHLPGQPQGSYSQSPSTTSLMSNGSSLSSRPTSHERPRGSISSSIASAGGSQCPAAPPLKKRKYSTDTQAPTATANTGKRCKSVDNTAGAKGIQSESPDQESPSYDRERHRRASARNWQKQKQHTADLEAAKRIAEARNRELHREYSEVLSQVMEAKNALMDHAKCNHPAISSWLRCQATNYVLNKGTAAGTGLKGENGAGGGMAASTYRVGRN